MRQMVQLVVIGTFLLVASGSTVRAETLTVTNTNDSDDGSLREMIDDADEGDRIVFAADVIGTITVTDTLEIESALEITGHGAGALAIVGAGDIGPVFEVEKGADLTISRLSISGGETGIENQSGTVIVIDCAIQKNREHGILNEGEGTVTVMRSLIAENRQHGINNTDTGTALCVNSTIHANGEYGITNNEGTVTVANCTISDNGTSGIDNANGTATAQQTILAGNGHSCRGVITSNGFNISDDDTCHFDQAGDQISTNPLLGELADNDGPTHTRTLLEGSPAIDMGRPTGCNDPSTGIPLTTDQRGLWRPSGLHCDIGAYEHHHVRSTKVVNRVVATIDGDPVTLYELQQFDRNDGPKPPDGLDGAAPLDLLVTKRVLEKEVQAQGIVASDEEIDNYIATIRERNKLTEEQMAAALAQQGMTMERYREHIGQELEQAQLINREIRGKVNVTPEDVERYYQAHLDEYALPGSITISHIVLQLSEDAPADQVAAVTERAEQIHEQLEDGADFGELAKRYSEDAAAESGGKLGSFEAGEMLEVIERTAETLQPGEFSSPVRSPVGVHIVRLDDRVVAGHQPLETLEEEIRERLYTTALEERYNRWLQEDLRERHHVEIR